MYGDAVVHESGDKENNPLNQAMASALGSKPLDLKNKEDQATISAAIKAVEKKFGQINNMREDSSVFEGDLDARMRANRAHRPGPSDDLEAATGEHLLEDRGGVGILAGQDTIAR